MAYVFTNSASGNTTTDFIDTTDIGITTVTLDLPDPLIDWLPYKWEKYFPSWHLVRSYK